MLRSFGVVLGAGALAHTSEVAAPAADAQSYTYRGVTYSWTRPDGSDLVVRMTPGAADRLPPGVSPASIPDSQVPGTPDPGVRGDGCTGVPDSFGAADFHQACERHDACYSAGSRTDRLDCDNHLASDLFRACAVAHPRMNDPFRIACNGVGVTYYVGVRVIGWSHYRGEGSALSARRGEVSPEIRVRRG